MNILYTNFHAGDGGGHTTYVLTLLDNPVHTVFVACPGSSLLYKKLAERGFSRLFDLSFPVRLGELPGMARAMRALARLVEEHDIDVVHTNGSKDNRIAFYARLLCKKKYKIVFTKHNSYAIKGAVSRWRFNLNDAVIFVSQSIYGSIGFSGFKTPVCVIENGVDVGHWQRSGAVNTGEKLEFISTAGTSRSKGWMGLVEACAGLAPEEKRRVHISVLGSLPDDKDIAKARELAEVSFPGFIEDARPLLEKADVGFVLSHNRETVSFACREMMAMSLPVLVSDYAGLPGNVDAGCGWVAKTSDIASIRQVVRNILAMSREELNSMKQNARIKAERDFSAALMREKTNAVYNSLFAPGSTPGRFF